MKLQRESERAREKERNKQQDALSGYIYVWIMERKIENVKNTTTDCVKVVGSRWYSTTTTIVYMWAYSKHIHIFECSCCFCFSFVLRLSKTDSSLHTYLKEKHHQQQQQQQQISLVGGAIVRCRHWRTVTNGQSAIDFRYCSTRNRLLLLFFLFFFF